jgi:ribosome-associated translation inhibitor RaiA
MMTIRMKVVDQGKLLSPDLAGHIGERAQKLGHFFDGVEECRVTVDGPGQHPRPGRIRVRVYVRVPGSRIAINRRTGEDLPMAIRESFDAADQRLEDYVRRRHRNSKRAKRQPAGGPSRGSR